mmetsp:Transcript_246/g.840  ORF Transcript_246/g.840 Transcript_246/m.840 type:complete len:255 (-) Transcript_246:509-1273(-)
MHFATGVVLGRKHSTRPPALNIVPVTVTHVVCLWSLVAATRVHVLHQVVVRCFHCRHEPRRLVQSRRASTRHLASSSEFCCYDVCLPATLCCAPLSFCYFSLSFPLSILTKAVALFLPQSSLASCLFFLQSIFLALPALALQCLPFLPKLLLFQPSLFSSLLVFVSSLSVLFLSDPSLLLCSLGVSPSLFFLQFSLALLLQGAFSLLLLCALSGCLSISGCSPLRLSRVLMRHWFRISLRCRFSHDVGVEILRL